MFNAIKLNAIHAAVNEVYSVLPKITIPEVRLAKGDYQVALLETETLPVKATITAYTNNVNHIKFSRITITWTQNEREVCQAVLSMEDITKTRDVKNSIFLSDDEQLLYVITQNRVHVYDLDLSRNETAERLIDHESHAKWGFSHIVELKPLQKVFLPDEMDTADTISIRGDLLISYEMVGSAQVTRQFEIIRQ